jgi:hypothetical protein
MCLAEITERGILAEALVAARSCRMQATEVRNSSDSRIHLDAA